MADHVVFGAGGQLGAALVSALKKRDASVAAFDRAACNITARPAVRELLQRERPTVVYNAAAFTLIDQAESVRDRAMRVNGIGAGIVAAEARDVGAKIVHFSTDYVFGDGHVSPIDEARPTDPLNTYAETKLFGEELVARNHLQAIVIRPGALYSHEGRNVLRRLITVALSTKKSITVVNDEIVSPTPASTVANVAIELGQQNVFGTFHAASHSGCSWLEFVEAFIEKLELDVEVHGISQERWGAPARRPRYSALDNMMLRTLGLDRFADWDVALHAFLEEFGERIIWELS